MNDRARCLDLGNKHGNAIKQGHVPRGLGLPARRHRAVFPFESFEPTAQVFFHMPEIGERIGLRQLVGWLPEWKLGGSGAFWHGGIFVLVAQNIAVGAHSGKAIFPLRVAPAKCACDISAERFVATRTQHADTARNVEAEFFVSRFHAPKLCLGETHVPERIATRTRKNAFGCGEYPLCTLLVEFCR
jgi:hypothetical protein